MNLANVEITINDQKWPELTLVVKVRQRVVTAQARFDQAEKKFQDLVATEVSNEVQGQIKRRQNHGI